MSIRVWKVAIPSVLLVLVACPAWGGTTLNGGTANGHFDRLVPLSSLQHANDTDTQGWLDDYGSTNDPAGMSSFDTPNVTVLWPEDDPVTTNTSTDHYYTIDVDGSAGIDAVFDWTPNDGCCGGPGWGPETLPVTFTADAGTSVGLLSMDIIATDADIIVNVDGADSTFTAPAAGTLDLSGTGFGQVVSFRLGGGSAAVNDWVADNITFSQTPEPSSAVLGLMGLCTLLFCGFRRREK